MNPSRRILSLFLAVAISAAFTGETLAATCEKTPLGQRQGSAGEFAAACTDTAVNRPSEFAWLLLAKICQLGSGQESEKPPACDWQGWATNNQTFPVRPEIGDPPKWPTGYKWPIDQEAKFEFSCRKNLVLENVLERRRNRPGFEYIIDNYLWYQETLVTAYNEDMKIDIPANTVDIAVSWKEIQESEKSKYHWKTLPDKKTICGLTTLDVKSKILPRWVYFSFEHVDNPGRCDYTGCRDEFGQKPTFIPPKFPAVPPRYVPEKLDERPKYEPGAPTEKLEKLTGLNEVWKSYYRLKGVQSDYVEMDGRPTILAGSQIEGLVFPASSSCITCHSRAGFNSKGHNLQGGGEVGDFQSPNGVPDPGWFYDTGPEGWQLRYKQSDSVWAIPINACPLQCPSSDEDLKLIPRRCNCGS